MSVSAERALQTEIVLRLKAWPVIAIPIPNSIYFPARTEAERSIISRVIHQMKAAGQILPGAPDLVLCLKGGSVALIEIKRPAAKTLLGKTPAGRPSETQIAIEARATELGIAHAYVTSWEEMRNRLIQWGVSPL